MAFKWTVLDFQRHSIREMYVNGLRVPAPEIQRAEVHQGEYMHDMMIFEMVWPDVRSLPDSSGWRIECKFGMDPGYGYFYGYVQTAAPVIVRADGQTQQNTVQFICLGATSVMQSGGTRNFAGMSADNVAQSLLLPYHLALVSDHHPYLFPRLAQCRDTDWAFLIKLARMVGYVVASSKVTVFFIDPTKVIVNTGSAVPITSMDSTRQNPGVIAGTMTVGAKGNVTQFTNTIVRSMDSMGVPTQGASSYDLRTSYLGKFTIEPPTTRYDPDRCPYDQAGAQVIANSQNRPEMWPMQSQLLCKGNGSLRPGVAAAMYTGDNQISGLWLTRSVVHQLGRTGYTMDVCIARDSVTNSPYPTPTITAGDRSGPLNAVAAPVITNGRWASIWSA